MSRSIGLVALFIVAVLGGTAGADEDSVRGRGWWGDLDKGEIVDLGDVVARPRQFTGRQISFFCIYRAQDDVFVPQGTIFSRRKYTNVSVWPDGTSVWEEAAYRKEEFPFLYIERTHPRRDELVRLPTFTRIEVTGRIRSMFRDRPFIDVASWRKTGAQLGQAVVDAVAWGDIYARGDRTELATKKYVEALRVDLPPVYDMKIRKRAGDAMRKLGYPEEAARIERGEPAMGGTQLPEPPKPASDQPGAVPVAPDQPVGFAPVDGPPTFAPPTEPAPTGTPSTPPTETPSERPANAANPFSRVNLPGQPYDVEKEEPLTVRPDMPDPLAPPSNTSPQQQPSRTVNPLSRSNLPGTPVSPPAVPESTPSAPAVRAPEATTPPSNTVNPFSRSSLPGVPVNENGDAPKPAPNVAKPPTGAPPAAPVSTDPKATPAKPPTAAAPKSGDPRRPVLPPTRRPRLVGVR